MQCIVKVPYVDIARQHAPIKDELLSAIDHVFDSAKFILGSEVEAFEQKFAQLCTTQHALGVHSGTDALILSLRAFGIGPGDEVITVSNSFISGVSCIVLNGAKPVLVDVRDDYTIDPDLIEKAITPKTKAIIPVHLTGKPADMEPICAMAKKHGLAIIEDCAQAVGATYHGKKVGSLGDAGCFSLHPLKTLNACGDGGIITTNNIDLYDRMKILRDNGFKSREECVAWSNNSRLDSIQAAMLLVKLKYLDEWTNKRIDNAVYYREQLKDVEDIQLPIEGLDEKSVYHTFVIRAKQRDQLRAYLKDNGVKTKIHYPMPIHLQPVAKNLGYPKASLPKTEEQSEQILSLPIYAGLEKGDVEYISNCIRHFYGSTRSACSPLNQGVRRFRQEKGEV